MSDQRRLEALKLAVGMSKEVGEVLAIAKAFEDFIRGESLAPKLEIVQDEPDTPQNQRRRRKGRR